MIELYGLENKAENFRMLFCRARGHWTIMIAGFTPIPYKLITITSGFAAYDIWMFILLSLLTRGARFFLLATLLYNFGDWIRDFIDRHFALLTTLCGRSVGVLRLRSRALSDLKVDLVQIIGLPRHPSRHRTWPSR